jgi:hypothetical protein
MKTRLFTFHRLLALLTLSLFVVSCSVGCDTLVSFLTVLEQHFPNTARALIVPAFSSFEAQPTAVPGSTVTHRLSYMADPAWQTTDLLWTPPPGASNFEFSRPPAPGGPPFRFANVPAQTVVVVSYTAPQLPPGVSSRMVAESLEVLPDGLEGSVPTAVLYTLISDTAQAVAQSPLPATAPYHPAAPGSLIDAWQVEAWVDILGQPLNTATCEEWLAFMQSDATFMALRLPVPAAGSIPLPFIYGNADAHALRLVEYAPGTPTIISGTLSYAADHATLLANTLPRAADEYWTALNVDAATAACPPGLNLPADSYGLNGQTLLDLSGFSDNCVGCQLALSVCYEGQEPPLSTAQLQAATGLATYQGEGVTCLGPASITLQEEMPPLELHGNGFHQHQPTDAVAYHHTLIVNAAMNVTLSLDTNLAAGWAFYGGDDVAPDLNDPITGPVFVPGFMDVWVVGQIPGGAADGAYHLTVTAVGDQPGSMGAAVHAIWLGDWVAPPPPIGGGGGFKLFLPAVTKP